MIAHHLYRRLPDRPRASWRGCGRTSSRVRAAPPSPTPSAWRTTPRPGPGAGRARRRERSSSRRRVRAALVEAAIGGCYVEHGFERGRRAGRRGLQRAGRLRARRARRLQDRPPGGARTSGLLGNVRRCRDLGPAHQREYTSVAMVEGTSSDAASARARRRRSSARPARRSKHSASRSPNQSSEGEADVPEGAADAGVQVVSRERRAALRPRHRGGGRPQRLWQVQHRRRPSVGDGRLLARPAASPDRPGRALRRVGRPPARRRLRGRARPRQPVRDAAPGVQRGVGHAPPRPGRRERVPGEPGPRPPARRARAPVRHGPRARDALR